MRFCNSGPATSLKVESLHLHRGPGPGVASNIGFKILDDKEEKDFFNLKSSRMRNGGYESCVRIPVQNRRSSCLNAGISAYLVG